MQFLFSITWGAVSGWWMIACLLLGLLYAWLMYRQPVNISDNKRYWLAGIRAVGVFLISFLLISPLVKSTSYQPQKPLVLIAQDNSESINTFKPAGFNPQQLVTDLGGLKQQLGDQYDVREFHFDSKLNEGLSNSFNGKQTNLSAAIGGLSERFVNQNIGAVVLATDGLYNQGADPQYLTGNLKTNIYTIALGDTVARRDLLVANVNYNKTAFLGNDFEIEVLVEAYQSKGENARLSVTLDGGSVFSQNIPVTSDAFKKVIPVKLTADKKGIRKFNINLAALKNELSTQNNSETIYVEVLDAKQKILLLYSSANPDLTVIKQAIESNKNYELKTALVTDLANIKPADYSLFILYQLPAANTGVLQSAIGKGKTPVWYFMGAQTDIDRLNAEQKISRVSTGRLDMQEVFAQMVPAFSQFTLSDSTQRKIEHFPPLLAPFGNYSSPAGASVLLKQKIGSVSTSYPLLSFGEDNGRREAVFSAEGVWRWQLSEYQSYGNHHALEELFGQSVQYLTANANQQRFRVYPAKNVFDEGEDVLLNAELYNDALELVNTPDVKIDLKGPEGKNYSYLFSRNGQSYQLDAGVLPVGEYTYTSQTKLGEQLYNAHGQLTIKALNLENRQSAANHQLLNAIAKQSGGTMLPPDQIKRLADLIRKNDTIKTVVYEDKRYSDIIDLKWIFVLILALLSTEWFLRKREGEV